MMVFVSDEEDGGSSGIQVGDHACEAVTGRIDDSDAYGAVFPEGAPTSKDRHVALPASDLEQSILPLRGEGDTWNKDEGPDLRAACLEKGSHRKHCHMRLSGTSDDLDDAPAAMGEPLFDTFPLPLVWNHVQIMHFNAPMFNRIADL